jgi:hypothetical protein
MNYPQTLKQRNEINLRQGIKTSMPKIKSLFALSYALYELNNLKCELNFCREDIVGGHKKIVLNSAFEQLILEYFGAEIKANPSVNFLDVINQNPLFTAQLEALQVTLELFWRLGKIHFVDSMPASGERTGNDRFQKIILFSTNMDILQAALQDDKEELKQTLFNWICEKNSASAYNFKIKKFVL